MKLALQGCISNLESFDVYLENFWVKQDGEVFCTTIKATIYVPNYDDFCHDSCIAITSTVRFFCYQLHKNYDCRKNFMANCPRVMTQNLVMVTITCKIIATVRILWSIAQKLWQPSKFCDDHQNLLRRKKLAHNQIWKSSRSPGARPENFDERTWNIWSNAIYSLLFFNEIKI